MYISFFLNIMAIGHEKHPLFSIGKIYIYIQIQDILVLQVQTDIRLQMVMAQNLDAKGTAEGGYSFDLSHSKMSAPCPMEVCENKSHAKKNKQT